MLSCSFGHMYPWWDPFCNCSSSKRHTGIVFFEVFRFFLYDVQQQLCLATHFCLNGDLVLLKFDEVLFSAQ